MRRADYIIDLGPGPGVHGGEVVAMGTLAELMRHPESVTGQCLRAHRKFPTRGSRRSVDTVLSLKSKAQSPGTEVQRREFEVQSPKSKDGQVLLASTPAVEARWLTLRGANKNNLKNLTVSFPLGRLVLVTGVSGSGKSTLIRECLLPALKSSITRPAPRTPHPAPLLTGFDSLQAVYEVDQSPIGRTPRSIPPPTSDSLTISANCSRKSPRRGCGAIRPAGSRSTARKAAALNARELARSSWR